MCLKCESHFDFKIDLSTYICKIKFSRSNLNYSRKEANNLWKYRFLNLPFPLLILSNTIKNQLKTSTSPDLKNLSFQTLSEFQISWFFFWKSFPEFLFQEKLKKILKNFSHKKYILLERFWLNNLFFHIFSFTHQVRIKKKYMTQNLT